MHLIRRKLGARGKISWYNSGSGTFTFKTGIIALFIKHHLTLLSSTQNVHFFMFSAHGKFNFGGKLHNFLGSLLQNSKCWTLSSFERVETNGFFGYFQEEADPLDEVCGCVRWPKPFDYDEKLIPPEPNFFTTGFLMDKEDR